MHVVYCKRLLIMYYSKRGCYYASTIRDKATNIYHWKIRYKDSVASPSDLDILDKAILLFTILFYFFSNAHWNLVLNLAWEEDVFEIGAIKRIFSNEKKIRMNNVLFLLEKKTSCVIFVDSELKGIFVKWAHLLIFSRTSFRLLVVSLISSAKRDASKEFSWTMELKVHKCRFENLPTCCNSSKNNILKVFHS